MLLNTVRRGIKIACIDKGISVAAAANKANINKSTIYRFLQGGNSIRLETLDNFCCFGLQMSFQQIIDSGK